nr:6-bladed beta-propeller [Fodinibius salicampi]
MTLISCENNKVRVSHPTEENIPKRDEIVSAPSFKDLPDDTSIFSIKDIDELLDREPVGSIDEGNKAGLFSIKDVAIDSHGHIFILPYQQKTIKVFSRKGSFISDIGKEGRGPGEFLYPTAIDTDQKGNLYVLDRTEIDVFKYSENQFTYSRPFEHGLSHIVDLCTFRESIFVSGYTVRRPDSASGEERGGSVLNISNPIHQFNSTNGKPLNTFGKIYQSNSQWPVFSGRLSDTKLACNESTDTIVGVFTNFPFVRGYQPDGKIKWTSVVDDYRYKPIIEEGMKAKASIRYPSSKEPFNEITHFTSTNKKYVFLQIENRIAMPNKKRSKLQEDLKKIHPQINTFLIDGDTGEMTKFSNNIGHIYVWKDNIKVIKTFDGSNNNFLNDGNEPVNIY